jgi:hypothetical protein
MLVGEARKGRFGLFADIVYTDIEMEDPVPYGILYSAVDSQTKSMYAQVLVVVYRAATLFSKTVENLINERSKYEKNQSFSSCVDYVCGGTDFIRSGTCR